MLRHLATAGGNPSGSPQHVCFLCTPFRTSAGWRAQVGIPLTMAQLEAASLQGAVAALVAARQHLLAARACRQLGLDVSQARTPP
jgi:hypothetical protein